MSLRRNASTRVLLEMFHTGLPPKETQVFLGSLGRYSGVENTEL